MVWNGFQRLGQLGRNVGQGFKDFGNSFSRWNNTYTPLEQAEVPKDVASTGSNIRDIGFGVLAGLAQVGSRPQTLYPTYNYVGNGLARSGFAQLDNPYYINPDMLKRVKASMLTRPRQVPQQINQNFNNGLKAIYPLPTSQNIYLQPGIYDNNGQQFNPFTIRSNEFDNAMRLRFNPQTGEY